MSISSVANVIGSDGPTVSYGMIAQVMVIVRLLSSLHFFGECCPIGFYFCIRQDHYDHEHAIFEIQKILYTCTCICF